MNEFAALAQTLAQTAITIAGDLCVSVAYRPTGTIAYAPDTGTITNSAAPLAAFAGLLTRFTTDEASASDVVQATDAKLIVAALDLGVTPNINDTCTTTDDSATLAPRVVTWKVIRILSLPGNPLHKLHVRET
jgi:hypothetical protein